MTDGKLLGLGLLAAAWFLWERARGAKTLPFDAGSAVTMLDTPADVADAEDVADQILADLRAQCVENVRASCADAGSLADIADCNLRERSRCDVDLEAPQGIVDLPSGEQLIAYDEEDAIYNDSLCLGVDGFGACPDDLPDRPGYIGGIQIRRDCDAEVAAMEIGVLANRAARGQAAYPEWRLDELRSEWSEKCRGTTLPLVPY